MTALNPAKFIREVRQEMKKVTWPTRKETLVSTSMVLILAILAAIFFVTIDWLIHMAINAVLGL